MAITTFTAAQVLTAAQMNAVQGNDYNQTVSTKTASYTLVAADKGTRVVMNVASANTVTVNTSLFTAGDTLVIQNIGAGVSTVTAGTATVSSAGPLAIPQYGSGTLYFTSAGVAIFFPSAGPAPTSGLTFIAGGTVTDTTSVNNCFSATYLNYKVVFSNLTSGDSSNLLLRLRVGGTDNTSSVYSSIVSGSNGSSGTYTNGIVSQSASSFALTYGNDYANGQTIAFDMFSPFAAKNTQYGLGNAVNGENAFFWFIAGIHKSTTSFDGFTIFPTSSTLAGTYKIYGYANS